MLSGPLEPPDSLLVHSDVAQVLADIIAHTSNVDAEKDRKYVAGLRETS